MSSRVGSGVVNGEFSNFGGQARIHDSRFTILFAVAPQALPAVTFTLDRSHYCIETPVTRKLQRESRRRSVSAFAALDACA